MSKYKELTNCEIVSRGIDVSQFDEDDHTYLIGAWLVTFSQVCPERAWLGFNTVTEESRGVYDSTVNQFGVKEIFGLFRTIMDIALERGYVLLLNYPACPKRGRVYSLAAKKAGCDVFECPDEFGATYQAIYAPGYTMGP